MKQYQTQLISQYENLTGFEFLGKDDIKTNKDFWLYWDKNLNWFENILIDLKYLVSPFESDRPCR
jgi:hypothetical protein